MQTAQDRDREMLAQLSTATGKSLSQIAATAGVAVSTLTRLANYKTEHRLSASTIEKLRAAFPNYFSDDVETTDIPNYVEVEVLPSFAGMGGGGYGEGEPGRALVPRVMVEDQLHGRAGDFLLIDVRGDSMVPAGYLHGDQILVDRRDRNPSQPGPFALYDGDTYVVKLVERVPSDRTKLRIFSANQVYREYEVLEEEARIIGRPVWLGRLL